MATKAAGVFLISGIPGSGKSTIARLLADQFERSAHIESDILQEFTIAGRVPPNGEPVDEAHAQLDLRTRNLCSLADNYVEAGFVPIIDDLVATQARLNRFQSFLRARPLHFVVLCPSLSTVLARLEQRGTWQPSREERQYFASIDRTMRAELDGTGLWIDTEVLTPDTVAERILRESAPACR